MKRRVFICRTSQISPDKPFLKNLTPFEQVVVFQTASGYYALENRCPHAGAPLHEGTIEDEILMCHWHGWRFDLESGVSLNEYWARVKTYPVQLEGEKIYIRQDRDEITGDE